MVRANVGLQHGRYAARKMQKKKEKKSLFALWAKMGDGRIEIWHVMLLGEKFHLLFSSVQPKN